MNSGIRKAFSVAMMVSLISACGGESNPTPMAQPIPTFETPITPTPENGVPFTLEASEVNPGCVFLNEAIEVAIYLKYERGRGITSSADKILVPLVILEGDENQVLLGNPQNQIATYVTLGKSLEAVIPLGVNLQGTQGEVIFTMPIVTYTGVNDEGQFCFEAPKIQVEGELA